MGSQSPDHQHGGVDLPPRAARGHGSAMCEAWAVSSNEAELVLGGGRIRTPAHPSGFAAALAIRDGVIQAAVSYTHLTLPTKA